MVACLAECSVTNCFGAMNLADWDTRYHHTMWRFMGYEVSSYNVRLSVMMVADSLERKACYAERTISILCRDGCCVVTLIMSFTRHCEVP